jgi:hypothetical protein
MLSWAGFLPNNNLLRKLCLGKNLISRFSRWCYSVYWSIEVHLKTSPPTPLLAKERGDKAQLYRGEVELYLSCLRIRYKELGNI